MTHTPINIIVSGTNPKVENSIRQVDKSYFTRLHFQFCEEVQELAKVLENQPETYWLFTPYSINQQSRKILRSIRYNYPNRVILIGPPTWALPAWQMDVQYFLPTDLTVQKLVDLEHRIVREQQTKAPDLLQIRHQNGIHQLRIKSILYCKGANNYTEIYTHGGRKLLVSGGLSTIGQRIQHHYGIERLGRSFYVNLPQIKEINQKVITFFGPKHTRLALSDRYYEHMLRLLNR